MSAEGTPLDAVLAEEFGRRLHEARERLYATLSLTDEELATLESHQPGAPSEDVGTETAATILSGLEGREKRELDEICDAEARLQRGRYGTCEGCQQPIPLARLRAMPAARRCVACQQREEKEPMTPGGRS